MRREETLLAEKETSDHLPSTSEVDAEEEWAFPDPEHVKSELDAQFTDTIKIQASNDAAEEMQSRYEGMVSRWKDEMDNLLVYAGLFSAVLTAFNVQSYQLLQPDPTDPMLNALHQISTQLNSFSVLGPFVNSTQQVTPSRESVQSPFRPSSSAIWINCLWFSSLVCSLAAASIALIVKQWLHEMTVGLSGTSRESARLRQHRLNGLMEWRVGLIVTILPILLQMALVLFIAGLLILLWTIHNTVAAVTSAFSAALFLFLLAVTILPVARVDCCYRSPQVLAIYETIRYVRNFVTSYLRRIRFFSHLKTQAAWRDRDLEMIAKNACELDRETAVMAYTTTFAPKFLDSLAVTFGDMQPLSQIARCFEDMRKAWVRRWGEKYSAEESWLDEEHMLSQMRLGLHALRVMLSKSRHSRDEEWERATDSIVSLLKGTPFFAFNAQLERYHSIMCPLAVGNTKVSQNVFDALVSSVSQNMSFSSIRSVMLMCEYHITQRNPRDRRYDDFRRWMRATALYLVCATTALSEHSSVPPDQMDSVCTRVQNTLAEFLRILNAQEWQDLDAGMPEKSSSVGFVRYDGPFSYRFVGWLRTPIMGRVFHICHMPRGREMVPPDIVAALERALSAVEAAFPEVPHLRSIKFMGRTLGDALAALGAVVELGPGSPTIQTLYSQDALIAQPEVISEKL